MKEFLAQTDIINWQQPDIQALASKLYSNTGIDSETAKNCFLWVRDNIRHSWDHKLDPVTCTASEVLEHGSGYCYAKSHLLAALLRANRIPTGLCYQRLSLEGNGKPPYCLHGLNAVYLNSYGWYRIDARGNKEGVHARFTPPLEQLAFPVDGLQEADLPGIRPAPLQSVIDVLRNHDNYQAVYDNLPDVELNQTNPVSAPITKQKHRPY